VPGPRLKQYTAQVGGVSYSFNGLIDLMAKASPRRSGDELAGCAASSDAERAAAQWALADVGLDVFLEEMAVGYEEDEVTRVIIDSHGRAAFQRISHLSVGGLRDWLLDVAAGPEPAGAAATLAAVSPAITPELAAAVSKIMRNQDLIAVARAVTVT
jgi:ethanolamine ammonia-lyase large subunit